MSSAISSTRSGIQSTRRQSTENQAASNTQSSKTAGPPEAKSAAAGAAPPASSFRPADRTAVRQTQSRGLARPRAPQAGTNLGRVARGPARSDAGGSALRMELAQPVFGQPMADPKSSGPIKPGAVTAFKEVDSDPRVTGQTRVELGKLVGSPVFQKLDAKGQAEALRLFKENLGDPAALKRVLPAVQAVASSKSQAVAQRMLEGLRKGSPLTDKQLTTFQDLMRSKKFTSLSAADQQLVAKAIQGSGADPIVLEGLKGFLEDPKIAALSPKDRSDKLKKVTEMAGHPKFGTLPESTRRAGFEWFKDKPIDPLDGLLIILATEVMP